MMQTVDLCPVCESNTFIKQHTCVDNTVSHETFDIIRCTTCELSITSPRPEEKSIGKYYLSNNYISHTNKAQTLIDKVYLVARRYTLSRKVKLISKYKKTPGKILDYGCGTGEFLKTCKQSGWEIQGVEPSLQAREKASELTQEKILATLHNVIETNFDVATLWHVLEHVSDLDDTLQKLYSTLKKDGTLIIAVPNCKSFDADHYLQYWAGYDVPRHLWHFSKINMTKLLDKNAFKLVDVIPMKLDAFYISLLSEKYKLGGRSSMISMLKAVYFGLLSNLKARRTGNYSSLIYIIKK